MAANIPTLELLQILEQEFAANLRPATLQELGQHFDASAAAVRYALLPHIDAGEIVKLPGARGYMPKWAAHAIAAEGLKRIQDPSTREKLQQVLNPPVKVRVCDCMRNSFGHEEFPNPSTHGQRAAIARDHFAGTRFIVDAIVPTENGYDIIAHPGICDCGADSIAWKCPDCGVWICECCDETHVHRIC
jgi:hypothetical protein